MFLCVDMNRKGCTAAVTRSEGHAWTDVTSQNCHVHVHVTVRLGGTVTSYEIRPLLTPNMAKWDNM